MNWLLFIPITLVVVYAHCNIAPSLTAWGIQPDFLAAHVVFISLYTFSRRTALPALWTVGFAADLFSSGPLGLHALTLSITGFILATIKDHLFLEHPLTQVMAAMCIAFASQILYFFTAALLTPLVFNRAPIGNMLYVALYSGILAPLVIGMLMFAKSALGIEGKKGVL